MNLDELAAATSPTLVHVPDAGRCVVPAPTVRLYVEITAALRGAATGDLDDADRLDYLLSQWLPGPVCALLPELSPEVRGEAILRWLNAGVPQTAARKAAGQDGAEGTGEPPPFDMTVALAEYAAVYGGSAWDAYSNTPWPFFVLALDRQGAASARELLRQSRALVIPHLGKAAKGHLERLQAEARGRASGKAGDGEPDSAPPEVIAEHRARLRAMMGAPAQPTPAQQ